MVKRSKVDAVAAAGDAAEPKKAKKAKKAKQELAAEGAASSAAAAAPATPAAAPTTPAAAPVEQHLIYVGGLPYSYDEEAVRGSFSQCGEIVKVHRMLFPDTGKFRGIALVTFATAEGAQAAKDWDGQEWEGRFLTVKDGKAEKPQAQEGQWLPSAEPERPKEEGSTTAFVGNLSIDRACEADLYGLFTGVSSVRFKTDKDTGRPRGFAFVEFESEAALEAAMKLDGTPLHGRPVKMHYSATKKSVGPPMVADMKGGKGKGKGKGKGGGKGKGEGKKRR